MQLLKSQTLVLFFSLWMPGCLFWEAVSSTGLVLCWSTELFCSSLPEDWNCWTEKLRKAVGKILYHASEEQHKLPAGELITTGAAHQCVQGREAGGWALGSLHSPVRKPSKKQLSSPGHTSHTRREALLLLPAILSHWPALGRLWGLASSCLPPPSPPPPSTRSPRAVPAFFASQFMLPKQP